MGRHPREIELDMEALENASAALMIKLDACLYLIGYLSKVNTVLERYWLEDWMPDKLDIRKMLEENKEAQALVTSAAKVSDEASRELVDMRARHYPQGKMFEEGMR